jgi:hypothetical protein
MAFEKGNKKDGNHYWLTPPALYEQLRLEFDFDYDPCPFPKPDDYDGLKAEWGESNYVNPPFGSYTDLTDNKKKGPTAWANKAIKEYRKGKRVVLVYPIDKWVLKMIEEGAVIRNLKDIHWHSCEDYIAGPGTGRHVACFILDPKDFKKKGTKELKNLTDLCNNKTDHQKTFDF